MLLKEILKNKGSKLACSCLEKQEITWPQRPLPRGDSCGGLQLLAEFT